MLEISGLIPFLGLDVNRPSTEKITESDIRSLDRAARSLEADIRPIADDLQRFGDSNLRVRYCVDFDVLFSTMGNLQSQGEDSSWSSLSVDISQQNAIILPGTLFEILRHARRYMTELDRFSRSTMSAAFFKAFEDADIERVSSSDNLNLIVDSFSHREIKSRIYFILEILRGNLFDVPLKFPEVDDYIFTTATNVMSRGARVDKILNNRADALNFAVTAALNSAENHSDSRFVIVSNSDAMRRLNQIRPVFHSLIRDPLEPAEDVVWSARRAAIYQMLLMAKPDESHAARVAWALIEAVVQLRVFLSELRSKGQLPTLRELRFENVFMEIIASFDFVQKEIESFKRGKAQRLELMNRSFDARNPKELYLALSGRLQERLNQEGMLAKISPAIRKSQEISVCAFGEIVDFCFDDFRELTSESDDLVAAAAIKEESLTVWTVSEASLAEYIHTLNLVRDSIIQKATAGTYRFRFSDAEKSVGELLRPLVVVIGNGEREQFELPLNSIYDLASICSRCGWEVRDIQFIRVDTEIFSSSYEGSRKVFRVSHDLRDEIAIFLGRLVPSEFKSSDLRDKIYELVPADRLLQPNFA